MDTILLLCTKRKQQVTLRNGDSEIAEKLDVSVPYVNRIIKGWEQIVNKTFVKIMDELGYDVELTYKKRQPSEAVVNRDL